MQAEFCDEIQSKTKSYQVQKQVIEASPSFHANNQSLDKGVVFQRFNSIMKLTITPPFNI